MGSSASRHSSPAKSSRTDEKSSRTDESKKEEKVEQAWKQLNTHEAQAGEDDDEVSPLPLWGSKATRGMRKRLSFSYSTLPELTPRRKVKKKVDQKEREKRQLLSRTNSSKWHADKIFRQFFWPIFEKADENRDGLLNAEEFLNVCRSGTLNLDIDHEDANTIWTEADAVTEQEGLTFEEFLPIARNLILKAYTEEGVVFEEGESEWIQIGWSSEDSDALPIYLNRTTGSVTYEPPDEYASQQVKEFELYESLETGLVVTTYEDEETGQRYFLNAEANQWCLLEPGWDDDLIPVPDHHIMRSEDRRMTIERQITEYGHSDNHRLEKIDSIAIPCSDGTLKELRCFSAENTYQQLYFFDSVIQDWVFLPVAWELHRPAIKSAVQSITTEFPTWQNLVEILLALRFNNYDIEKTKEWKRAELAAEKSFQEQQAEPKHRSTSEGTDMHEVTVAEALAAAELHKDLSDAKEENLKLQEALKRSEMDVTKLRMENVTLNERVDEVNLNLQRHKTRMEELEAALKEKAEKENDDKSKALSVQKQKIDSCSFTAQELKLSHQELRKAFHSFVPELQKLLTTTQANTTALVDHKFGSVAELEKLRELYEMESLKRKILYNKLQELRGSIRVICRCRKDDRVDCALRFPSPTELSLQSKFRGHKTFQFDRVYTPSATQEAVYDEIAPSIRSCLDGYNVSILAYGQTGSGKTHTMMGTPEQPGMIRQAVKDLLKMATNDADNTFKFEISMMEIYNERICDLLNPHSPDERFHIHSQHKSEVVVEGLTRQAFATEEEVLGLFVKGAENRHVAATLLNSTSSRSHMVVTLYVEGESAVSETITKAKLNLVDLAGSERVAQSGSTGMRFTEAASINKSLVCLGLVFQALRQKNSHVPYRNSKLTYALQDSLGGNAKVTVFVNVSPAKSNISLTESALNFGLDVGAIELGPIHHNKKQRMQSVS